MTYFYTCIGCSNNGEDCANLRNIRSAIKGFGIRSLRHTCKDRMPLFDPGDQVLINIWMYNGEQDEYDLCESNYGTFRGVFIEQKGTKGICFIKPGSVLDCCDPEDANDEDKFVPRNNGYVKVPLSRISKIDNSEKVNVTICSYCGARSHLTGCGDPGAPCESGQRNSS